MKEMKMITVYIYNDKSLEKHPTLKIYGYPEVDKLLTDYANKGYSLKTMTEYPQDHDITFVFERDI